MSKNTWRGRAVLIKCVDPRAYKILCSFYKDWYDEDFYINYPKRDRRFHKWWKPKISQKERRQYRTWKYNRKTQWKNTLGNKS